MKQLLLNLILITLFLNSKGQHSKIEYGLQAGVNISTAYGTGISKEFRRPLTGLNFGGHLKVCKTENWGLKLLILYDEIGWKYKSLVLEGNTATGLVNADIDFKLDYLNLPVLVEYSYGTKVKLNLDGGVFLGILLNNKMVTKLYPPIPPNQAAVTQTSPNNKKLINFGLSMGAGIQIPVSPIIKLNLDVRNYIGLPDIYKSSSTNNTRIKTFNTAIAVGFSYVM